MKNSQTCISLEWKILDSHNNNNYYYLDCHHLHSGINLYIYLMNSFSHNDENKNCKTLITWIFSSFVIINQINYFQMMKNKAYLLLFITYTTMNDWKRKPTTTTWWWFSSQQNNRILENENKIGLRPIWNMMMMMMMCTNSPTFGWKKTKTKKTNLN